MSVQGNSVVINVNENVVLLLMQLKFEEERAGRRFPAGGVIYTSVAFPSQPLQLFYFNILYQYKTSVAFPCQSETSLPETLAPDVSQFHMRQVGFKCPAMMNSNHTQLKKKTN